MKQLVVRIPQNIDGKEIYFRDFNTNRGKPILIVLAVITIGWIWIFYHIAHAWNRADLGSHLVAILVLSILGWAPFLLWWRALRGSALLVQLDEQGITLAGNFRPWSEVYQINSKWHPIEFGYQFTAFFRKTGGIKYSLYIDSALNTNEHIILVNKLKSIGINIIIK